MQDDFRASGLYHLLMELQVSKSVVVPNGCRRQTTSARADHVEGDVDQTEKLPAPKVYAGKVVIDRRKTRDRTAPRGVPDPAGER